MGLGFRRVSCNLRLGYEGNMEPLPSQLGARLNLCQRQRQRADTREEQEEWWAEEAGLRDAWLRRDRTEFVRNSHPSVLERYELGLLDRQALMRFLQRDTLEVSTLKSNHGGAEPSPSSRQRPWVTAVPQKPLHHYSSGGQMTSCQRGEGLVVTENLVVPREGSLSGFLEARSLNCGAIDDPLIHINRLAFGSLKSAGSPRHRYTVAH